MIQSNKQKTKITSIRDIVKTSDSIVECCNRLLSNNLIVGRAEGRRLWFQLKDRV